MRKLILLVATSLDGFVAGEKGELDGFEASEENLEFVCNLTDSADAALFGRVSYQLLENFWPTAKDRLNASKSEIKYSNWYNAAEKIVISRTMAGKSLNNTKIIGENILNEITKIKQKAQKDILVFGSPKTSQALIRVDLIDEYWIFINPVIFGKGIPLFTKNENKIKLKLVYTKQFPNGEIALNYVPAK